MALPLFVPRAGPQLASFLFTDTEQAYQASDLAMLAHHLIATPGGHVLRRVEAAAARRA